MPASKIMVIRHAEKPNGEPGVGPDGTPDDNSLTATGWKRAQALAGLFDPAGGPLKDARLAKPGALFAASPNALSQSLRPKETITPLSSDMPMAIGLGFGLGDETALVAAAKAAADVVLICWHHEKIPEIAGLILGASDDVPGHWKSDRFDLVWMFDLLDGGGWRFDQVPQMLLDGDSDKPIKLKDGL
jgi:hypothetical protein